MVVFYYFSISFYISVYCVRMFLVLVLFSSLFLLYPHSVLLPCV